MYNIKLTDEQITMIGKALSEFRYDLPAELSVAVANVSAVIHKQWSEQFESVQAFEAAIKAGLLSNDKEADNFAGKYMYMGTETISNFRESAFKHRMTRKYVSLQRPI